MSDARPSILIADDTPANLELLGYLLGADYQIFLAVTGQEAVERALAHRPDLILMDVLMPGMDGFEACRRIKADARTADIPVIFVTAIDRVAEETRGAALALPHPHSVVSPCVTLSMGVAGCIPESGRRIDYPERRPGALSSQGGRPKLHRP